MTARYWGVTTAAIVAPAIGDERMALYSNKNVHF